MKDNTRAFSDRSASYPAAAKWLAHSGGKGLDHADDGAPESLEGTLDRFAEHGFQLGKSILDWVEVESVGREVAQARARSLDGNPDACTLVAAQIVHDDDVART